jgi:ABC-type nitrate/sulfonate/bicarbonate transport system ATPase subunit
VVATAAGAPISIRGVGHGYAGLPVLQDLDLDVAPGQRVGVIGPSGCGKSTLLHLIAGLDEPDAGTIAVGDAAGSPDRLARCALMPQDDLLLPWRSALDNAALALLNAGVGRAAARDAAAPLFRRFGLEGFEQKRPSALSGGMRQRVAFLRTLLAGKPVLLMDEPFASLDALTREELGAWLVEALESEPRTVVLVTHDVDEALRTCEQIVVLSRRPAGLLLATPASELSREDVLEVLRR